ncbi:MAG: ECF transporter S component [Ruminococcus sp.]
MNLKLKKIIMTALFAALACVATMSIRIPTPGTQGYIHPGDAIVILSGIILGPAYGFLAGGIGSAMADLLGGYFLYVPITFAVKGMIALICGLIYQNTDASGKVHYFTVAVCGIVDIIFVAGGYFLSESFIYGVGGAAASVPANIVQGISGLIISMILYPILMKIPDVRSIMTQLKHAKR